MLTKKFNRYVRPIFVNGLLALTLLLLSAPPAFAQQGIFLPIISTGSSVDENLDIDALLAETEAKMLSGDFDVSAEADELSALANLGCNYTGWPRLRRGAKGQPVKLVQVLLKYYHNQDLGVYGVDGDFGPITERLVRKVQSHARASGHRSCGSAIGVDGKVGPQTWAVLWLTRTPPPPPPPNNVEQLVNVARGISTRSSSAVIRSHINTLLAESQKYNLTNDQLAYVFATVQHETAHWDTLEEYASGAAYEGRSDLGNNQRGDGVRFKGRGYVQLTGRRNYQLFTNLFASGQFGNNFKHINLINNPTQAANPQVAAKILFYGMVNGSYTGTGLNSSRVKNANGSLNFVSARKIVNGTDRAHMIAGYANKYRQVIR